MGKKQKGFNVEFKCKICKFNIELKGSKESITINCNLLIQNHKSYSPTCKADKYEDFIIEELLNDNEYIIEARRLIEYSKEKTEEILSSKTSKLSDIIGNEDAKRAFEERLIDHIKYKDRLLEMKFYDECGILLAGIQGTGKTYLVSTVINIIIFSNPEHREKFDVLVMRASDFVLGNIGATSKMISAILDLIRKSNRENNKETILIVDEIDSLIPKRKTDRISSKEKMSAMLDEFGGIHDDHTILLIGMTNLPDDIDAHALVTGRFGSPILINIPTHEERFKMFMQFSEGIKFDEGVDCKFINTVLDKFSGRDVKDFVKDLHKLKMKKEDRGEHHSEPIITCDDIEEQFERKFITIKNRNLEMLNNLAEYYNRYGIEVEGSGTSDNKIQAIENFKNQYLEIYDNKPEYYEFTEDLYSKYNEWKVVGYVEMKKPMFNKIFKLDKRIVPGNPKAIDGKQHPAFYNVKFKDNIIKKIDVNTIFKDME